MSDDLSNAPRLHRDRWLRWSGEKWVESDVFSPDLRAVRDVAQMLFAQLYAIDPDNPVLDMARKIAAGDDSGPHAISVKTNRILADRTAARISAKWENQDRSAGDASFTPAQEARLREIVREEAAAAWRRDFGRRIG